MSRKPKPNKKARALIGALAALATASVIYTGLEAYSLITSNSSSNGQKALISNMTWGSEEATDEQKQAQAILYGLNDAMIAGDREAFISWGEGDGQAQLAAWWDITKQIGWEYASVDGGNYGVEGNLPGESTWFFSSELGSRITTLLPEEKGLILTQGEYYKVFISGEGENARIQQMTSERNYFAWSRLDGDVHVAKRDNSVTVGKAGEAQYIEEKADIIEQATIEALNAWDSLGGGELPTDGLLAQVSQDQTVLDEWLGSNFTPGISYSGLAITSNRPFSNQPYISSKIATGERTSGSFVLMSPRADSEWSNGYASTVFHEALHVFHRAAYPLNLEEVNDIAAAEGFAVYGEMLHSGPGEQGGYNYYNYVLDEAGARERIANAGFSAVSSQSLRNQETAADAYIAAGLIYDYAATEAGIPAWNIALTSTQNPNLSLAQIVLELGGGQLSSAGFSNFVMNRKF